MPTRTTEAEMADAVKSILSHRRDQSATYEELRDLIPNRIQLSKSDRKPSPSRPAEQLWMQILRNLISHKHEWFVSIAGGIKLQWRGKAKPKSKSKSKPQRSSQGGAEMRLAA